MRDERPLLMTGRYDGTSMGTGEVRKIQAAFQKI
jgi:hypothetical protein